jgi:hypothetical protein
MRRYVEVRNALRQDASQPVSLLRTVAIGGELAAQKALVARERAQGIRQIGETTIGDLSIASVTLDNTDPSTGKVPTVLVDVCLDVTAVDVIDKTGQSVIDSNRPDTGWIRYSVANYVWSKDPVSAWRVTWSKDLEGPSCAAS